MMNYTQYTDRQKNIIDGKYKLSRITNNELNRLMVKALYIYDAPVVDMVTKELTMRNVRITRYMGPYSKRQEAFISGELPISEASTHELKISLRTARSLCDKEAAMIFEAELKKRGPLLIDIEGYSAAQTQLILGIKPIEQAQDGTVTSLANMAEYLCDEDVAEFANAEEDRRGLKKRRSSKRTVRIEDALLATEAFDKASDLELCQVYFDAYRMESPLIDIIEDSIEERNQKLYRKYYTQQEISTIEGQSILDDESLAKLEELYYKVQHDESLLQSPFFKKLEEEFMKREAEWEKKKQERLAFSDRQLAVILGDVPVNNVRIRELKTIANKAAKLGEKEIADHFRKIITEREKEYDPDSNYDDVQQDVIKRLRDYKPTEKRKIVVSEAVDLPNPYPKNPRAKNLSESVKHLRDEEYYNGLEYSPYTDKELKIINEEIQLSAVTRKKLGSLIRKARKAGDDNIADRLEAHLAKRETFSATDEEDVVTGKLPYEEIPVKLLKNLARKAKANGDLELLDTIENLLYEKNADAYARKAKSSFGNGEYEQKQKTPQWAMQILLSEESTDACTIKDLQDIRLYSMTLDDPVFREVAEFFIAARVDPSVVYEAKTKEEAEDLIAKNTLAPIRWPEARQ